ncbi:acyl carrier protein [Plantactinospora sp. KLBMP9567]|uniref:acyl carrier protein n=1 Tax=Plantactinospora sp. KLBMP9567 TaxID=3085900 RepID=UPI002982B832|nr:acyl carrier protein [Plantactinospora sp. KLBMP9567]MDW5324832.1 acyl carrier protein [Plantactinospora sp. KLBMP9567]
MLVRERLRSVFLTALDLPAEVNVTELQHRVHPRWDSLGHLALVIAIEEEFDVEFDSDQLIGMDSFQSALKILHDLGVYDST